MSRPLRHPLRPARTLVALATLALWVAATPLQAQTTPATPTLTPTTSPTATPAIPAAKRKAAAAARTAKRAAAPATVPTATAPAVASPLAVAAEAAPLPAPLAAADPTTAAALQAQRQAQAQALAQQQMLSHTEGLVPLLSRALAADPQVRVAQTLLQATDDRRKQARSRLAPNLALTLARGDSDVTETGLFGTEDKTRRNQRADAALRWNLYNGGNDMAELEGATRDVAAAEADLRRAREESAERIAGAYLELLRIDGLLPRARQRLDSVTRLVALVKRQNDAGKASDADMQQARAYLLDAEIAMDQLETDRTGARQRLSRLAGEDVRAVYPVVLPTPPGGDIGVTAQQAAAELRAQAARDRVRPLASLAAPRIDFEFRKALSDKTTPQVSTLENRAWGLSARWDFPLGGESVARRSETQRRAEAAEAEADRLARGTRAELDALMPQLDGTERSVARLEGQIEQYRSLIRAGELQFEAGRRSLAQLIQLHDSLYSAERNRAEQANRLQTTQLRRLSLTGNLLPLLLAPAAAGEPAATAAR